MINKKKKHRWLSEKYSLIIRKEENFEETSSINFNRLKLILLLIMSITLFILVAIFLTTILLPKWLDPRYSQIRMSRQIIELSMKIDSLEYQEQTHNNYVANFKKMLSGESDDEYVIPKIENKTTPIEISEKIHPIDSAFRKKIEGSQTSELIFSEEKITTSIYDDLTYLYLFSPIEGIITDGFDPQREHYGIDIVAQENETVKSVADGIVILSSWTLDGGYILVLQHIGNLISVYKHNADLFKNVGNFVAAGEVIAIIGNTGELTSGPHLHLEIWHNGHPVNPQEYIAF